MPTTPVSVSVVVPVYRSEASIAEVVHRLSATLAEVSSDHEIILVDDGSPDGSWKVIEALVRDDPRVRAIALSRNYGQHNALLAGVRAARHDVVVTIDDDLQHPPEQVPLLLDALTADIDLVYGYPATENHSAGRNLLSRATKIALGASIGSDVAKHVSAFRAFRARLRDGFADAHDPFMSLDVLLSWSTTRATAIPVAMDERRYGTSNYSTRKLVRVALNLITGFSTLPLRIVTYVGFGFALFGVLILAYVLTIYIAQGGRSAPGFPFLASLVSILSGAQLFALGVIGEYIGRMHYRSMNRPAYLVRDEIGDPNDPGSPA